MTEPPLKICAQCRGVGGDCSMCNGRGVGVPLSWLLEHDDEYDVIIDAETGRQWAERKAAPSVESARDPIPFPRR